MSQAAAYAPAHGASDEAFDAGGDVRPPYAAILGALHETGVASAADAVTARIARDGVLHGARGDTHLFPVDAVPRVFEAGEWDALAAGLRQRVRALEAFVADAHGPREAFAAGVVPADLLDGCPWAEDELRELPVRGPWIGVSGPDVVRTPAGELVVLEDNVRTPTLMAFALLAERVTRTLVPTGPAAAPLAPALREHLHGLVDEDACVAILARDAGNVAAWEIEELGRLTGWPVVGLGDLEPRGDALVLRGSGRRVDVLWRRTSEERLRDDAGRLSHLGELLLPALLAGTVAVVNAFGTGVADDKRVHPYVEELVRWACGTEPLLRSVPEVDPRRALGDLRGHVVKPRSGSGGFGVMVGPLASEAQLAAARAALERDPGELVVQEAIAFSVHPTHVGGRLAPRHVDLRPFALCAGGRVEVVPGGLTRVALAEGDLLVNCSQGGSAKDVWVLD